MATYINEKAVEKFNEKLLDANEASKGTTVAVHLETDYIKTHLAVSIDSICVEGHTVTIAEGDIDIVIEMNEEGEFLYEESEIENLFQYTYQDGYWFEFTLDFI